MSNNLPSFADDGVSEDGAMNIDEVIANFQSISDRCIAILPALLKNKDESILVELDQEVRRVYEGIHNIFIRMVDE
jgi:hypothetical protein